LNFDRIAAQHTTNYRIDEFFDGTVTYTGSRIAISVVLDYKDVIPRQDLIKGAIYNLYMIAIGAHTSFSNKGIICFTPVVKLDG
jgi:hypothetical protein